MKIQSILFCALIFIALILTFSGCKKYLDAKPDQSLATISNTTDLQSLLDEYFNINTNSPSAEEVSCDDYFLSTNDFLSLDLEQQRNMYTWQPANLFYPYTNQENDWTLVYDNAYVANTVLDNMNNVNRNNSNSVTLDNIQGQALFLRAYSYYKAVSIWCPAYDPATSKTDLGIALRLNSNFNEKSTRATVEQSYAQIINDAKASATLLPPLPIQVYRAGKAAAYALLSKTYLSMRQYEQARQYADSCLKINSQLLDYNSLNTSKSYPLPQFNPEVIYESSMNSSGVLPIGRVRARIDTSLISQYSTDDLRLPAFYTTNADGNKLFRGSYEGASSRFNGLATDEIYLIRAECAARAGKTEAALQDLNTLLKFRFKTGTFTPIAAANPTIALSIILNERRKELVMRGTRWNDIKRLNKENAGITLKRIVNGKSYTLPPNDFRYALPIPDDIIALTGMPQNPR